MKWLQRKLSFLIDYVVILLTVIILFGRVEAHIINKVSLQNFEEKLSQSWRYREYVLSFEKPELEIWDLIEAEDSTIWAITNLGFAYFDKYKWSLKPNDMKHFKSIPGMYFNSFSIVSADYDKLFFIQNNSLYSINKQEKVRIPILYGDKELKLMDLIKYNGALIVQCKEDKKYTIYKLDSDFKPSKIDLPVDINDSIDFHFARTNDESLWLNSENGIYRFKNNKWYKILATSSILDLRRIIKFNDKYLFFINYPLNHQGIWEYDNKIIRIDSSLVGFKGIDKYNNLLLTVLYSGYSSVFDSSWIQLDNVPRFLKSSKNFLFSKNGDLWTFNGNTINRVLLSSNLWEYWDFSFDFNAGFINDIIKSKDGFIWLATGNGVEKRYDGKLIELWTGTDKTNFFAVTSIIEDKFGRKWIGSGSHFTNPYYFENNKWKKFELLPDEKKLYVHKIRKDSKGRLWFLTLSNLKGVEGYGAICYDYDSLIIWDKSKGLINNRVYDFVEDSSGAYWFATAKGICRYKNDKWTYWDKKSGLTSNTVFTIELHPDGKTIFFSNYSFGGFGYIKGNSLFYKYNSNSYDKIIARDFIFDKYGKLWLSSSVGLYCDIGNQLIKISEREGLINDRCWALFVDNEHLYIGTTGSGVNVLHYSYKEEFPPEVEFQYNLNGDDVNLVCNVFSYGSYFNNNSYYIKYKINNGNWTKWIKNNPIHIYNLEHGINNITFKIMSPLGIIYDKDFVFTIELETPIYYQIDFIIPFFIMILLVSALISYFIYKRRIYRKRVEKINQDLKRNEQLYKSVFDKASDGILINKNGKINYWNRQIMLMSGYEANELYNASLLDFVVDEDKSIIIELQRNILFNKSFPERFEIRFIKKSGNICWIDVRVVLLNKTDKDYETIVFITDIDLRKQYELKLQKALEKEAELSEMKSSIISTISHEYRTPLTVVQTSVDLLKLYYKSQDDQKFEKYINRINLSIDRMIAFLEDIMFLGKVESKNYDLITEDLELSRFCHDVISNALANNNSNRKIVNNLKEKFIFKTDRTLLHTILYRVLDNAIKHSGSDSDIYLNFKDNDDSIVFEIIDNGKGIEPEKLSKIYDPFHRINEGEQKKGTGFGLTIVKACVENLMGEIQITSNINEGTKVLIELPKL